MLALLADEPNCGRKTMDGLARSMVNNSGVNPPEDNGYGPRAGLCLKPQNFSDATNHSSFPKSRLEPSEVYTNHIVYKFAALWGAVLLTGRRWLLQFMEPEAELFLPQFAPDCCYDLVTLALSMFSKKRLPIQYSYGFTAYLPEKSNGSAHGIRTRVPALRGLCPRPLDERAVRNLPLCCGPGV